MPSSRRPGALIIVLSLLAGVPRARADALREAKAAEQAGDAARAYAAYRVHATHEVPAGSDAMRALLPVLDRAAAAWIGALLDEARGRIDRGDARGALAVVWGLHRMVDAEIPGHDLRAVIATRQRDLEAVARTAIAAALASATPDVDGLISLAALAPFAPTVPPLRARLDELRATLTATHREPARRADHVGRLHGEVIAYLEGKVPDGRRSGVTVSPRAEGDASCAPFVAALTTPERAAALRAQLVVRSAAPCQLETTQTSRTEPYEYTVSERYETQECHTAPVTVTEGRCLSANNQNCVLRATGTTSGGERTCKPVTRTRQRVVTDTREVTRVTWTIRWRGELTMSAGGAEVRRPFDVTASFVDEGHRSSRDRKEARLDRAKLDRDLASRIAEVVAGPSGELHAGWIAAARLRFTSGEPAEAKPRAAALLFFEDTPSPEIDAWLAQHTGVPRHVLAAIRAGEAIPVIDGEMPLLPQVAAGATCPECLAAPRARSGARATTVAVRPQRAEGWMGLRYTRVDEPMRVDDAKQLLSVAVAYDVVPLAGTGMFVGFDLELGGGGGFRYDTNLRAGWGISRGGAVAAATLGAGVGGLTGGRIPIALQVPVELLAGYRFGPRLALAASARSIFAFGADARADGSTATPLGDELELELTVLAGKKLALSGLYAERLKTSFVGVAIGIQLQDR